VPLLISGASIANSRNPKTFLRRVFAHSHPN
jgi:hypothetical protein